MARRITFLYPVSFLTVLVRSAYLSVFPGEIREKGLRPKIRSRL